MTNLNCETGMTTEQWAKCLEKWADELELCPWKADEPDKLKLETRIMALRIGADAIRKRGPFQEGLKDDHND